ncbi:MAG: PP_RS20740 family protein [Lysobacter sp.]
MAPESEDGGDDYVDDLVQQRVTHPELPPKDKFFAWHKPRKHWIRRNQWQAEAAALIKALNLSAKRRPLSYLSLPGPDMLDVRTMQQVCSASGADLRFVGFMDGGLSDQTELNISLDEVMRLDGIDQESTVILDPLQSLADPNSVGYARAMGAASFDIVNIDLCNSIGAAPPLDKQAGCYEAIRQILDLQRRRRPAEEPWILFLTTRANHVQVHVEARAKFFDCLLRNARDHAEVDQAIRSGLNLDQATLAAMQEGAIQDDTEFENAFAAAVSKWLLQMLGSSPPAGTLELLPSSCTYSVRVPGSRDMLSLGFLCQTIHAPSHDAAGLAAPAQPAQFPTEPQAAAAIIRLVPQLAHVDAILADPVHYDAITVEASELMRSARFDAAKYIEWARASKERQAVPAAVVT